ncbi:MAG: hypothetical protein Q9201_005350 [Fulgogasparrea decipioides]
MQTSRLRNAAAHRNECTSVDWVKDVIDDALRYVRMLNDEETALQIERLMTEALSLINEKRQEWMSWCESRKDCGMLEYEIEDKIKAWRRLLGLTDFIADADEARFAQANIWPIIDLYERVISRIHDYQNRELKRLDADGGSLQAVESYPESTAQAKVKQDSPESNGSSSQGTASRSEPDIVNGLVETCANDEETLITSTWPDYDGPGWGDDCHAKNYDIPSWSPDADKPRDVDW